MGMETISGAPNGRFVLKVPHSWKSFQAHPMILLGDVSKVEARFCPFGDSVNLNAR
jgi:hypothetical protein